MFKNLEQVKWKNNKTNNLVNPKGPQKLTGTKTYTLCVGT